MTKQTALWVIVGTGLLGASALQAARMGAPVRPVSRVSTSAGPREVAAEGRVVAYPGAEVLVGAERAGRLERVLVEERQAVAKGALLAEFESDELRAALAEARARITEAVAEVRLAEANLARKRQLVSEEIVSSHDFDQATRDLETAEARLATVRATVGRIEAQLKKSRVVAPIAGTVLLRHVDAGETIEAGDRVVTLADLGRLRVEGEADEADAAALAVGAPVRITSDGYPGRSWLGRVEEVPDSVTLRRLKPQDPARPTDTRVLAIKVAFAEPAPLKLGTTVELRIAPPGR
ncbi:MAG TPA: efflux RND transporter periplasmic adaptor subunit [Vicinamibacteria bacterium]|nr:efflux RND transporter periplasmic adaptor subunit [Vicinamibacteria bacterium]